MVSTETIASHMGARRHLGTKRVSWCWAVYFLAVSPTGLCGAARYAALPCVHDPHTSTADILGAWQSHQDSFHLAFARATQGDFGSIVQRSSGRDAELLVRLSSVLNQSHAGRALLKTRGELAEVAAHEVSCQHLYIWRCSRILCRI